MQSSGNVTLTAWANELPILPALGRRHRLELSMVSPELVIRFQGITYGLRAKGCYTEARRGKEFYTENIYT